jgi:hypothetical protein
MYGTFIKIFEKFSKIYMKEMSFQHEYDKTDKTADLLIGMEQRNQIQSLQLENRSLESCFREKCRELELLKENQNLFREQLVDILRDEKVKITEGTDLADLIQTVLNGHISSRKEMEKAKNQKIDKLR